MDFHRGIDDDSADLVHFHLCALRALRVELLGSAAFHFQLLRRRSLRGCQSCGQYAER